MKTKAGLLVLAASMLGGAAVAHHASSEFDHKHTVTVEGVVHEFRWTSPHAWLFVDVPGNAPAGGRWAFEGASIPALLRNGWKSSSVKAGDRVRVTTAPRRDGGRSGELLSLTLTDSGKVLKAGML